MRQAAELALRRAGDGERRRRRRPGRGRRSSRRCWASAARPPGTYSPTRSTGTQRSVTVPPGDDLRGRRRCGAASSWTSRARRIDSSSAARTCGSSVVEGRGQRLGRDPQASAGDAVEPLATARAPRRRRGRARRRRSAGRSASAASTSSAARGQHRRAGRAPLPTQVDAADHRRQSRERPGVAGSRGSAGPRLGRDRADPAVPAGHRAVPRLLAAAAHLRGALPAAGPAPARQPPEDGPRGRSASSRSGSGREVGADGVTALHEVGCAGRAARGRGVRRRPLRHRDGGRRGGSGCCGVDTTRALPAGRGRVARRAARATRPGCSRQRGRASSTDYRDALLATQA